MPTYEYRCENGHSFEEFQSILADPIEICPVCGGKAVRQISGGSGLIFKGSGFYITDYVKKSGQFSDTGAAKPVKTEKAVPESKTETVKKPKE